MTVCEQYAKDHDLKPLTKKELFKGKDELNIYNTDTLMPWTEIYTRITAGVPLDTIAEIYGHIRKITLWAIEDGIDVDFEISEFVDNKIRIDRQMNQIEGKNAVVAETLKDVVSEYAPDIKRDLAIFSKAAVRRGTSLINDEDCSSADFKNVMAGMLTLTDMTSITERHSTNAGQANLTVHVEGFAFEKDEPKEQITDVEVIEDVKE